MEFINSPEGAPWRADMDMCREIRNLLTHTADVDGQPVVTPASGVVERLRQILNYLESPPMALEYAIKAGGILKTTTGERALPLMQTMSRKGYSHVPVMRGEAVFGVFSVSTVFSSVLENGGRIDGDTRVGDFGRLLPVDSHMCEQFGFISENTTLPEARAAFERTGRKRMAALFITDGGRRDGKLFGMLTPWDVLRRDH